MPRFDLPLEQLGEYRTETAEPRNLTRGGGCDSTRPGHRPARRNFTRYEAGRYGPVEVQGPEFVGAGGDRIRRGTCRSRARTDRHSSW